MSKLAFFGTICFLADQIYEWRKSKKQERQQGPAYGLDAFMDVFATTGQKLQNIPIKARTVKTSDVRDRVGHIITVIKKYKDNPDVNQIASAIISRKCGKSWCTPEKDWVGEQRAIFDEVRKRVRYKRDVYKKDTYVNPLRTLLQFKGGDCDDFSIVLGSLYLSIGHPVKLRIIQPKGKDDFSHIYLLVGSPPDDPIRWIPADASMNQPFGWQAPRPLIDKWQDFVVD